MSSGRIATVTGLPAAQARAAQASASAAELRALPPVHLAAQEVHLADEVGDESGGRMPIDLESACRPAR